MSPQVADVALASFLAESPAAAAARGADVVRAALGDLSNIALFGAGTMGRATLARLRVHGVEPSAYIDDTPSKQGTILDGLAVLPLAEALDVLGPDVVVVVTILNPQLTFLEAAKKLGDHGLRSASLMLLRWCFPESFGDLLNTAPPAEVVEHRQEIELCRSLWSDAASATAFDAQVRWRLTLDFGALPPAHLEDIYFPTDVDLRLAPDVTFLDAGAYDGDSAEQFICHTGGAFGSIVAVEPDPRNFEQLSRRLGAVGDPTRTVAFNMGVGETDGVLRFNASGDMSAAFDETGDTAVRIRPLSAFFPDHGPVYAKFDIEGAEWATLLSARRLISDRRPTLAISVYHEARDLWRIPLLIHECLPDAELYLRAHGVDGTDVVLYAV
jgi:FkbM family methyltransferase